MHRLTALLIGALRLIGSTLGFGGRLIADRKPTPFPSGDQPLRETKTGADQAEGTFKQRR